MAVASSNKFPKVIYNISTGVAAASTGTYNSWMSTGGKLTVTSSSGGETIVGPSTAATTIPADSSIGRLYTRPTAAHTDDDEFAGTGLGGWTTLTVSGTGTWTESAGAANVLFDNQTAGDVTAIGKAITSATAPMTIETSVTWIGQEAATNPNVGLFWSDGITGTNNTLAVHVLGQTNAEPFIGMHSGTFTDILNTNKMLLSVFHGTVRRWYLRAIWKAASTWKFQTSPNGIVWTDFDNGDETFAMTPTHFGLMVGTYGGGTAQVASFEYFRVYDSDTSA